MLAFKANTVAIIVSFLWTFLYTNSPVSTNYWYG